MRKVAGGDISSAQTRDSTIIELALYSGVSDSTNSVEGQRRQLSSFALSATVTPEKSVDDALGLLRATSTYERLQHTYYEFKKSRSLLSNIKLRYILAFRIAAKVIESGGENTFLQKQEFHSGVRADFYDTPQGVAKRTIVVK